MTSPIRYVVLSWRICRRRWRQQPGPMKTGLWLSLAVVLFFAGSLLAPAGVEGASKAEFLWRANPNEVGDTLAGFAGALAFIWLIVTVTLQSQELKAQRKELQLTRREFRLMAKAQAGQLNLMHAQTEVFEDEKKYREEQRAADLFDQRLEASRQEIERGRGFLTELDALDKLFYEKPSDMEIASTGYNTYASMPLDLYLHTRAKQASDWAFNHAHPYLQYDRMIDAGLSGGFLQDIVAAARRANEVDGLSPALEERQVRLVGSLLRSLNHISKRIKRGL